MEFPLEVFYQEPKRTRTNSKIVPKRPAPPDTSQSIELRKEVTLSSRFAKLNQP
jgi:hypothetical protein